MSNITDSIKEAMQSGKIFSVVFTKKDGSTRKLRGRMGVTKHHVHEGRPSTTSHIPKYLTVFDLDKSAYRTVNVQTLIDFKCGDTIIKTGEK